MGNLKDHLITLEGLFEFRDRYNIPLNVQVRAPRPDESLDVGSRDGMPFPTIAIVDCGVRFPLDPLLDLFFSLTNLFPTQCAPNLFCIVMGVAALNRLLDTSLGVLDILSCYQLIHLNHSKLVYYLKSRDSNRLLVHYFLDSNKASKGDFIIVSRN